jgi:hypothetical protein
VAGFGMSDEQFVETMVKPARREAVNLLLEHKGDRGIVLNEVWLWREKAGNDLLRRFYLNVLGQEVKAASNGRRNKERG